MKCPHCRVDFHDKPDTKAIGVDGDKVLGYVARTCSHCHRLVLELAHGNWQNMMNNNVVSKTYNVITTWPVHPKCTARTPIAPEVPPEFATDYKEACFVLADSPKASAALSRRCLQNLLRTKAGVKQGNLANEIQQVLETKTIPSHLAESLDAIRHIGNFAAHPLKSTNTGEIIDVEQGEAEWSLDVLESLFEFYFVQPALLQTKKEALNKKLAAAGKPPMK